jgi:hypothetical protein
MMPRDLKLGWVARPQGDGEVKVDLWSIDDNDQPIDDTLMGFVLLPEEVKYFLQDLKEAADG